MFALLLALSFPGSESVWLEAEWFAPLRGANFSFMSEDRQTRGSWSVAGPDVAAAWTQGGESEFMSIAARADEPAGTSVSCEIELPEAGDYRLWVRYADYRGAKEELSVSVRQGSVLQEHTFGTSAIVDELDPMKLLWDWSYAWDSFVVTVGKGAARVEIATTGQTGARRCVDCLCLTTDGSYKPVGREKPSFASWSALGANDAGVEPLSTLRETGAPASATPPAFLWNVGAQWSAELGKPLSDRMDVPFGVDPPLLGEFLATFRGSPPPVYGDQSSGPVWHVPEYPGAFSGGSAFLDWLERHPSARFGVLLNYGEPRWPAGADRKAVYANLRRFSDRFVGFIAGENVAYANVDQAGLEAAVRAAKDRDDVLAALKKFNTEATVAKFSDYFGVPLSAEEAWSGVVSCLSANNEALCHALCAWGVKRIGHENTGNSPALSRRLAFLRGAARQFGCKIVDYQSANLGDAATMFSREAFFYPASSRYILDNSYDAWAGAGTNWLLKDYLLWYFSGADAFYNEQGVDMFWKPGGNAAGDGFPVQLSPKGKVAEAVQRIVGGHPRPEQFAPIALLLDDAHGWSQERFQPGAFGLDPSLNPGVLTPGAHEAAIRGWFDVAYYPAPLTAGEPASAIRQTFVNGVFGDLFDVIVAAPGQTAVLDRYSVVVMAGEVGIDRGWSDALRRFVEGGGTLVGSVLQTDGALPVPFGLYSSAERREAASYVWKGEAKAGSNRFQYWPLAKTGRVMATTEGGDPVVVVNKVGRGQVVALGVRLGLGMDRRPVAFLGRLMRDLVAGLAPVSVRGDIEWTLGRLPDGGWVVGLFNNKGIIKPQHGVNPTDHSQAVEVELKAPWRVGKSAEWVAGATPVWTSDACRVAVPAGAVRLVELHQSTD